MRKTNKKLTTPFDTLIYNLKKSGYKVVMTNEGGYKFAKITGKWIRGGFCEYNNGNSYSYIDGRICFDNVKCFDKWSKCPYSFPIPTNSAQLKYILSKMKYLASKKGYTKSNEYDLQHEDKYPNRIRK